MNVQEATPLAERREGVHCRTAMAKGMPTDRLANAASGHRWTDVATQ